jgi:nucleosome binding factor SPN SPT16 subunit
MSKPIILLEEEEEDKEIIVVPLTQQKAKQQQVILLEEEEEEEEEEAKVKEIDPEIYKFNTESLKTVTRLLIKDINEKLSVLKKEHQNQDETLTNKIKDDLLWHSAVAYSGTNEEKQEYYKLIKEITTNININKNIGELEHLIHHLTFLTVDYNDFTLFSTTICLIILSHYKLF